MPPLDPITLALVSITALVITGILVRGITSYAAGISSAMIETARNDSDLEQTQKRHAEKMGRAAGLEPLAQTPDGSIMEPIMGIVERR